MTEAGRLVSGIYRLLAVALASLLAAASSAAPTNELAKLDRIAEDYVRLQLEIGAHDNVYVGNYFGPKEWREAAKARPRALPALQSDAERLLVDLRAIPTNRLEPLVRRRHAYLEAHLKSASFYVAMLHGKRASFMEEVEALYGVKPKLKPLEYYDEVLARIGSLVPGPGPLPQRLKQALDPWMIPADRLEVVMRAASNECRRRTLEHMDLPAGEVFNLKLVAGEVWSGSLAYDGDYQSTIRINAGYPLSIFRAVELGCHEGYPGHHTYVTLLDRELVRKRGWIEHSVIPIVGPLGLIIEGGGSCAPYLAFSPDELARFERETLLPLAGLPAGDEDRLRQLQEESRKLQGARLTIGQMYLDGEISRPRALELMAHYQATTPDRAEQVVAAIDKYRTYIVNYVLGEEVVCKRLNAVGGNSPAAWQLMQKLLSEPTLPSDFAELSGED